MKQTTEQVETIYYDGEEFRQILGHEHYYVSRSARVYSMKRHRLLKPILDSKGNYLTLSLDKKCCLLHRLVAIAFIPNPDNLPEVNHKDKNKQNCHVDNLEWCTRKDNLNDSYSTMSPTRNYRIARLYRNGILIGEFKGVAKAARYAADKFGASFSALDKYLRSGEFRIEYNGEQTRSAYVDHPQTKTYKKTPIRLYRIDKNNQERFIQEFKTFPELSKYLVDELHIQVSEQTLHNYCDSKKALNGYKIKR